MIKFALEDVPYFSQTDNKIFPVTTCYPTSLGMAITYCLDLIGLDKTDIGCPCGKQIEDFITEIAMSSETKKWIKNNVGRLGNWMLKYKPRTIAYVEEMIFNKLLNKHGFKATFRTDLTYGKYCSHIDFNKLPIVLHGDFRKISKVKGHITLGIGYDESDNIIIVNDPYGNAIHDKYRSHKKGEKAKYPLSVFVKDKKAHMWGQVISRI